MSANQRLIRRKSWFLTYPRAENLDKDSILNFLLLNFKVKEYVIAEEKHKDNSKHFHAYILLNHKVKFKKNLFDVGNYHGNYQPVRNKQQVLEYIIKEDKNFLTNINVEALKKKKNKHILKDDYLKDPITLLEEGKITFFQIHSFLQNQNLYKSYLKNNKIDLNIEKKRHKWFWGASNTGKTYYLRRMISEDNLNWFQMPLNNDWNGYSNELNIYIDEFKGQISIQELNRLCDGGAKVNTKGSTLCLRFDVVLWVFSNYSINNCYKNCESGILETLHNRFEETEMVRFCVSNITYAKTDRGPGTLGK